MALKFGLLFAIRNPERWAKPWPQIYSETLEQIQAAEELGFDSVWMSEHHGADDGYLPSTLLMAGVAAAHTKRITIGVRLLLLPLHHPVRVAEDAAVVDVLSNGRLILGAAVGYRPEEFPAFGVNRRYRPSLMDEGLEIIRRCWSEERFDYHGRRWNLEGVSVVPKPVQQPGPPIWLGGSRGGAIERIARSADGYHFVGNREVYDSYARAMVAHDRDPRSIPVYDSRDFWVGEDAERAWEEAREHLYYSTKLYAQWGAEAAIADGVDPTQVAKPPETPEEMRERAGLGGPFVGTPDQAVDFFRRRQREVPIDGTIMRMPPGMEHRKILDYLELMAKEVLPQFD